MADTNRTEVPTAWLTGPGDMVTEDFVLEHGLACRGSDALQTCRVSRTVRTWRSSFAGRS